jgi:hypothetical protein
VSKLLESGSDGRPGRRKHGDGDGGQKVHVGFLSSARGSPRRKKGRTRSSCAADGPTLSLIIGGDLSTGQRRCLRNASLVYTGSPQYGREVDAGARPRAGTCIARAILSHS